jgi:hypothetical protein
MTKFMTSPTADASWTIAGVVTQVGAAGTGPRNRRIQIFTYPVYPLILKVRSRKNVFRLHGIMHVHI